MNIISNKNLSIKNSEIKNLFGKNLVVLSSALLSVLYVYVDQAFSAKISPQHLYAEMILSFFPLLFVIFSQILGSSVLVLLNKDDISKDSVVRGSFGLGFLLCFFASFLIYQFKDLFLGYFELKDVAGIQSFFKIQLIASIFMSSNLILKFVLIAKRQTKSLIKLDLAGNIINILINSSFVYLASSDSVKFSGLAIATLAVQLMIFGFLLNSLKEHFKLCSLNNLKNDVKIFLDRAKNLVKADVFSVASSVILPFAVSAICKPYLSMEEIIALNAGFSLKNLALRPFSALGVCLLPEFSRLVNSSLSLVSVRQSSKLLSAIWLAIWMIPVGILLENIGSAVYGINSPDQIKILYIVFLSALVMPLSLNASFSLKAKEKNSYLAKLQLLFGFSVPLVILVLMQGVLSFHIVLAAALIIPAIIKALLCIRKDLGGLSLKRRSFSFKFLNQLKA
jgi:Na+-driven multidrug efflux pump